jgi:hypothetical protein
MALSQRVNVEVTENMSVEGVRIAIKLSDASTLSREVAQGRGSLSNPLSDDDLEAKLIHSVLLSTPDYSPLTLIERVWSTDALANAADLFDCLPTQQYEA